MSEGFWGRLLESAARPNAQAQATRAASKKNEGPTVVRWSPHNVEWICGKPDSVFHQDRHLGGRRLFLYAADYSEALANVPGSLGTDRTLHRGLTLDERSPI